MPNDVITEAARQYAKATGCGLQQAEEMLRDCVWALRTPEDRQQMYDELREAVLSARITYPTDPSARQRPERRRRIVSPPRNRHPSQRRSRR